MAQVPDEAIKSGKEISFPAKVLYQLICAYRNSATGECYLKDQKRMATESGISYCHISTVKRELLAKGWVRYSESGRLVPIKGTFIKSKSAADNKDDSLSLISSNSFTKSKSVAEPVSLNESASFTASNGTEVAIKGNILLTNNTLPTEEKPDAADSESLIWVFRDEFQRHKKLPYRHSVNDQVAIVTMKQFYDPSIDDWKKALKNYFATPKDKHWIGDLCEHYDTYFVNALDRYKKPADSKTVTTANGSEIPKGYMRLPDGTTCKKPAV